MLFSDASPSSWLNTGGRSPDIPSTVLVLAVDFDSPACLAMLRRAEEYARHHAVAAVHRPRFGQDVQAARKAVLREGVGVPVLHDPDGSLSGSLRLPPAPAAALLGPDGTVADRAEGADAPARLAAELERLEPAGRPPVRPEEEPFDPETVRFPLAVLGLAGRLAVCQPDSLLLAEPQEDKPMALPRAKVEGLDRPCALAPGGGESLALVAESGAGRVLELDVLTGEGRVLAEGLDWPCGVAFARGRPWVALGTGGVVGLDPETGEVVERLVGAPEECGGLATDGQRVWVADAVTGGLRVDEDGRGFTETVPAPESFGARCLLAPAWSGDQLAAADPCGHAVFVVDESRRLAGTGRGVVDGPKPRFQGPRGLAPAPNGWLLADTDNHAVRVVSADGAAVTVLLAR
ncbi:hypothetical protein [Desulfohalovibrio reitneri]|uniref:hypothetical protein n=1 Tax=Desulfohalovibrio reitneri TaxID=1307759 RepID=UPI0004A72747|nr:hypothetical protein [Desulfohalovibrio reitneri]